MKILTILAIFAATGLQAATADVLFYGGDFDNVNGLKSEVGGKVDARVYDDFSLSQPSEISGIFGTFLSVYDGQPATAYFELRSGVEPGHGGQLLASGYFSVDGTLLEGGIELPVWQFSGDIEPVQLDAGDYFLTMAMSEPGGFAYILATTSGANGIGEPLQNGNSFYDSRTFGFDFEDVENILGPGPWDFSLGIEGTPVPEPHIAVSILCGVVLLWSRRAKPSYQ